LSTERIGRRTRLALAIIFGGLAASVTIAGTAAAVAAGGCQPGSGPQLAGRHLTSADLSTYQTGGLRCANLAGADLSGLSLIQIDFTGAILRNANLQHADLTQAVLDNTDLSGANLTDATMGQVSAMHAKMVGANLSGVDLSQADLTGADLSKTKLSGTSFVQATLDHTTFTGATGLPPWNLYVLIVAALILVLLAWGTLRRSARNVRNAGGFGYANATGNRPAGLLVRGLIGSVVVALGLSLALGGFLGEIAGSFGPPVTQTCAGALCKVGVSSGFIGIFGGIVVIIIGFVLRGSGRRNTQPNFGPGFSAGTPFGGTPFS
jgi:hypothetical protein